MARNLRRDKAQQQVEQVEPPAPHPVIDNDNLVQAMEDVRRVKSAEKIVFSVDPSGKNFRLTSPDVSCSLAFNGRASSLLINPVLIEDLPLAEVLKLDGPASIQDDTLQLEVLNGTEWELREITVGVTLERKAGANAEVAARARVIPAAENSALVTVERRSDMTLLYHLKATSKPFSTTIFRENIGITPSADEDWRWSIVEAKGIRPGQGLGLPETLPGVPPLSLPSPQPPLSAPVDAPGVSSAPDIPRQTSQDKVASPSATPQR
ncbi:MAG: hypothetical protein LAO56_23495 [Acidobacteriia bacterium]|nr:hypothetical protein [Terriglobia bacterium]